MKKLLIVLLLASCEEPYRDCTAERDAYLKSRQEWSKLRNRYVDLDTLDDRTKELKRQYELCQSR